MPLKEYPTLTALMAGREPGSVKVRLPSWNASSWLRPYRRLDGDTWATIEQNGLVNFCGDAGPWLLVSEDAPALDTLRLEIAARVLASLSMKEETDETWALRHAYALAEADALIAEARK